MTVEYRIAHPDDMPAIMLAQAAGFGSSTAAAEVERSVSTTPIRPEWRLCAFEDGRAVAQMCVVPTVMYWNGREIAAAGVTDVFTLPTHRRRGHLRELMTRAYALMHHAGQSVTILEASMAAIYQRFGWAVVYTGLIHDFDPRLLRFTEDFATAGRVRLVPPPQAQPLLDPVYQRFAARRTLAFRRGDFEWARALRLTRTGVAPPLVAVYEEAGEPLGYAIYLVESLTNLRPSDPEQRLIVLEWVWLTPAAHRALVQYLAGHDLVGAVRMYSLPLDDPLFYQVQEPRGLNTIAMDGALARIVDAETALAGRGYDGAGRLVMALEDPYAPWNSGVWELTVDGGATMRRVNAEPQLRLSPRVLAMLLSGYQPASTLARAGLIDCATPSALSLADSLFRTERVPLCLDHWM
jgi:predicted acetyltransferase